jgi:hypothetical protein
MKLRAPHSLVGSQIGFKETQRSSVFPNRKLAGSCQTRCIGAGADQSMRK